MKALTLILFSLIGYFSKADVITIQYYSTSQPTQDIYLNICDTLVIDNTSGYSYLMYEDTFGTPNNTIIYPDNISGGWQLGQGYFYDFYEITDGVAYIYHQAFPLLFIIHINPSSNTSINATICSGQSYLFNGQYLSETGDYQEFTPAFQDCDSVTNLHLEVLPPPSSITQINVCSGENYTFNDQTFSNSGTYPVVLQDSVGCDSIANLELIVMDPVLTILYEAICPGETFTFSGIEYSAPGEYDHLFMTADGCDSTVRLILSEFSPLYPEISALNDTILISNYSHLFGYELNWIDCITNTIIPGETVDFLNVSENGSYGFVVHYAGCDYYSDCYTVSTIGIQENHSTAIEISPNPTTNIIGIKTDLSVPLNVTISDLSGKLYFYQTYNDKVIEINVSTIAPGMYLLTVNHQTFRIEIGTK